MWATQPAFKRLNTRNISYSLSQNRSPHSQLEIYISLHGQNLRAPGVFSLPACLAPVYRLARKRHLTKFSPLPRQGRMERETGLGLDRAQTWPGHVTTTFVSRQTAARHQTVEKTGELWMAAGEMILHILSLVSTLCLLPSGWLKRSGLLGTTELPIKHVYWPTTLALRWQQKKGKCRYLDPFLSHYLITAQCSGSQSRNQPSQSEAHSSCFTRQFNQFGWKWH